MDKIENNCEEIICFLDKKKIKIFVIFEHIADAELTLFINTLSYTFFVLIHSLKIII